MTDLANTTSLVETSPQLPISWYVDPEFYEIERRALFDNAVTYIGHELMTPNMGDYYALAWMDNAKALVRNEHGIELISNICRHRQSIMLDGKGNTQNIVCPLHRWTYDMQGKLLGAPSFPGNPCLNLEKTPLQNWNGLLFTGKRNVCDDLKDFSLLKDFDFSGYMLDNVVIDYYNFNWKTFVEVYLEDYHVKPFHPGLGNFVDCDSLKWEIGKWYSAQTVGVFNKLAKPGTATYKKWHDVVRQYNDGKDPAHGAIWMLYCPNIMLEWYPHALVISVVIPDGPERCINVVEFYYPEDIALFEREYIEAEQAAYAETAKEDEEICVRMQRGRAALYKAGVNEAGPYQSPLEDGMVHFHEYIRREVELYLKQS